MENVLRNSIVGKKENESSKLIVSCSCNKPNHLF